MNASSSYIVQVTVGVSGNSATTSVKVQVGQSAGVKAVIAGGNQLTISKSSSLYVIDATSSYIIDYPQDK